MNRYGRFITFLIISIISGMYNFPLNAQTESQEPSVSLIVTQAPLNNVLTAVSNQAQKTIAFRYGDVDSVFVDCFLQNTQLDSALFLILRDTPLTYTRQDSNVYLVHRTRTEAGRATKFHLTGHVVDSDTGEPLVGANVYLANTTIGGATNSNGEFIIFNAPSGKHTLITSYVGYKLYENEVITSDFRGLNMFITMSEDPAVTGEVVVSAEQPDEWREQLNTFTDNFIGMQETAKQCKILNPEVLDFDRNSEGHFIASAQAPLLVENRALGYRITVNLKLFRIESSNIFITYYPVYEDLEPESLEELRNWEAARKLSYYGSLRHFLKSLVDDTLPEAGYELSINQYDRKSRDEKRYKPVNRKNISLTSGINDYERVLKFRGALLVKYKNEYLNSILDNDMSGIFTSPAFFAQKQTAKTKYYSISYLSLNSDSLIFNIDGYPNNPLAITTYGDMSWDRLADTVPLDYEPHVEITDEDAIENAKPFNRYKAELDKADSDRFINEFEPPFKHALEDEVLTVYESIGSIPDRKEFIKKYIRGKNDNPLFDVNYWFLEFISRYSYARSEFACVKPPYYDDRGKYWIRFGRPLRRFESPGGYKRIKMFNDPAKYAAVSAVYQLVPPSANFHVKANETWIYDQDRKTITIHFINEGRWKETQSITEALIDQSSRNVSWQWFELVKEREEISPEFAELADQMRYVEENIVTLISTPSGTPNKSLLPFTIGSDFAHNGLFMHKNSIDREEYIAINEAEITIGDRIEASNRLEFDTDVLQFRNEDGSARLEVVTLVPNADLINQRKTVDLSDTLRLEYSQVLHDSEYRPHGQLESVKTIDLKLMAGADLPNSIISQSLTAPPDSGDLTVMITDLYNKNIGFTSIPVQPRDFSGDRLMLSDIRFYAPHSDKIGEQNIPVTEIDGLKLIPYPYRVISRTEPAFCYFELYNTQRSGIHALYDIDLKLVRIQSNNMARRLFDRIRGKDKVSLSITSSRAVTGNDVREILSVDLSDVDPGEYRLEISVSDPQNRANSAQVSRPIRIVNK